MNGVRALLEWRTRALRSAHPRAEYLMGRAANALDWTEQGSGVGLRALATLPPARTDSEPAQTNSELRPREPRSSGIATEAARIDDDEDPPTCRFHRSLPPDARRESAESLSARGIARLSALADWIEAEEPAGVVIALVRAFLRDVNEVGAKVGELLAAAGESTSPPELGAAVHALALAIGLWRSNLVEHVDDLALSDHRSFSGWSSLPEYSYAYTLAIIRPALAEAEAWVGAGAGSEGRSSIAFIPLARAIRASGASIDRLNATLRAAVLDNEDSSDGPLFPDSPVLTAVG